EYERGNEEEGIRLMKEVVAEDDKYFWAWGQLAGWYEESEDAENHLEAAERLADLGPDNAWALAHRGRALLALRRRDEAMADLRRAIEVDPGYVHPGLMLFDLHMEDGAHGEARVVLEIIENALEVEDR